MGVGRAAGPSNDSNRVVGHGQVESQTEVAKSDGGQPAQPTSRAGGGIGTRLPVHDKVLGQGFISPGAKNALQQPGIGGPNQSRTGQRVESQKEQPPLELTFDWNRFEPDARGFSRANATGFAEISRLVYEDFGPPPAQAFKDLEARGFQIEYFSAPPVEVEVPGEKEGDPPVKKTVAGSTQAMLAVRGDTVIVAYRGTEMDSQTDRGTIFDFGKTRTADGQVHAGFDAGVDSVWVDLQTRLTVLRDQRRETDPDAKLRVHFTGHSLGAALSTISATRVRKNARKTGIDVASVYTFGSPKVGDARFLRNYIRSGLNAQTHRIDCPKDSIVDLPPDWLGYVHVGEQQSCPEGGHAIAGYCEQLGSDAGLTAGMCTPDSVAQSVSATVPARNAPQTEVQELFECFDNLEPNDRFHVMASLEPGTAERILKLTIPEGTDPSVLAELRAREAADEIAHTVRDRRFFGTSERAWLAGAKQLVEQPDDSQYVVAELLPPATLNRMRRELEELEKKHIGREEPAIGAAAEILRAVCR